MKDLVGNHEDCFSRISAQIMVPEAPNTCFVFIYNLAEVKRFSKPETRY